MAESIPNLCRNAGCIHHKRCVVSVYSRALEDSRLRAYAYFAEGSSWNESIIKKDIDDLVLYLAFTATFCWEDETELRSSLFGTIKRGNGECRGKADDGSEQLKRRALLQSLPPKLTFCFEKSNATKMEVCLELKNGEGELLLEPRSFVLRFIKPHPKETEKSPQEQDG